jgi:hypothetical protein
MHTRLVFRNGADLVVLDAPAEVGKLFENIDGQGFATLSRDAGGEVLVNPAAVAYLEEVRELTQISTVVG